MHGSGGGWGDFSLRLESSGARARSAERADVREVR